MVPAISHAWPPFVICHVSMGFRQRFRVSIFCDKFAICELKDKCQTFKNRVYSVSTLAMFCEPVVVICSLS